MAPLAFLDRMDRPWHWVALSAIILVVLEITYATLLYSPTIPTVLPLLAGLIFALSYRTPRKTLIPLVALMVFRSYLLLKEMQVPYLPYCHSQLHGPFSGSGVVSAAGRHPRNFTPVQSDLLIFDHIPGKSNSYATVDVRLSGSAWRD